MEVKAGKLGGELRRAIGGGGRGAFDVQYTYAANTSGRVAVRRATQVLPGGFTVTFNYSGSGGSLADDLSRVSSMTYNASTQVGYEYAGLGWVVRTDLLEPDAYTQLVTPPGSVTNPPTAPAYSNVDRFSRITSSRWVNTHDVDFYRVDLAYDRNSNITEATDAILTAGQQSLKRWDVLYSMDNLNRLTRAQEGTLAGGAISSMGRDERWTLSLAGNFANTKRDLDGSGTFTGAGEFDDDRAFNKANELLTRSDPSSTQTHNPRGEMVDDGIDYRYGYDAWGRLVTVKKRSNDALVAEYRYNGLGFRIGWHSDVTDDGTTNLPDGVVDGDDPWYWFCYDERWRVVATFRGSDASPKERFVWHNAGMDGMGGSSYIDAAVMADRDLTNGWAGAADGTLEKRVYMCQNVGGWRADAAVVLDDAGRVLERVKYSAYGVPFCISGADYNASGTVSAADATDFAADYNATDSRADVNFDGQVDFFDYLDFLGEYNGGAGEAGGWAVLSRASVGNRVGYAGYQWDAAIRGTTGGKWHVRHRVLDSGLGVWTRRDPLGYVDTANLYTYVSANPVTFGDWSGLAPPGVIQDYCFACCGPPPCCNNCVPGTADPAPPGGGTGGMSVANCNQCVSQAQTDGRYTMLISLMTAHGCSNPIATPPCATCGNPPQTPRGWYDMTTKMITLCADRMPGCTIVSLIVWHEMYHAAEHCLGLLTRATCCDCMCAEVRAYRWDRGCEDGGYRRTIPVPGTNPPHAPVDEADCLYHYARLSCQNFPCRSELERSMCARIAVQTCNPFGFP